MSHRIYIVEDHPLMRQMLAALISRTADLDLAGQSATGEGMLELLAGVEADLALIDVSLPQMNGFDLVRVLLARRPDLLCLMVSAHQEPIYVERALAAGARGYLVKGNPNELVDAIRRVLAGELYVSEPLGQKLDGHLQTQSSQSPPHPDP